MITTNIKQFFASKLVAPVMNLLYTDRWMTWIPRETKRKTTLPKKPTVAMLRNFSRDAVVRKAITIVGDTVSTLPYNIEVIGGRGKYTKQITAIQNIIEHPNIIDSRTTFTKKLIDDAMVLDAMCAEADVCNDASHPVYLYPVDGSTIKHIVPWDYTDPTSPRFAQSQEDGQHNFTAEQLYYGTRQSFTNTPWGLSPVETAYNYIKFYLDGCEQANDRATNATSAFLLNLGKGVTEEQRNEFCEYMQNDIEGTGRIPVVAADSVQTVQLKSINKDELFLDWINRLTQIISVAFGMPPEKLGLIVANDRSTGADQENAMIQELIKPYANMLEDLYNNYVIAKMGLGGVLKFQFIYEESEQQKAVKSTRLVNEYANDLITENEFRQLIGLDARDSEYADVTITEKKALINKDIGVNGQNGFGTIKDTTGGDNNGKQ